MRIASSVAVIGLIWMIPVSPTHAQANRQADRLNCIGQCQIQYGCVGAGLHLSPSDARRATEECMVNEDDCEKECKAKYYKWWEFWRK
jgi:hypothetical protein